MNPPTVYTACVYDNPPSTISDEHDMTAQELHAKEQSGVVSGVPIAVEHNKDLPVGRVERLYGKEDPVSGRRRYFIDFTLHDDKVGIIVH
jgi:hypothetical protein